MLGESWPRWHSASASPKPLIHARFCAAGCLDIALGVFEGSLSKRPKALK
jgi:hypothetical protein